MFDEFLVMPKVMGKPLVTEERVLAEVAGRAPSNSPFLNVMADSGRFAGKVNPQLRSLTTAFANSGFFGLYNSTAVVSAGKFIHDNTTNGGAAGVLTQPVIDLLAAMGRSGATARFGVEFFVARYTLGAGTLNPTVFSDGITRYLMTTNGDRVLFGVGSWGTFSAWMRCTAGSVGIRNSGSTPLFRNDVEQTTDLILSTAMGWNHVRFQYQGPLGYNSAYPFIHGGGNGAAIEIAIPAFFVGPVNTGMHLAPLPTINELVAV